MDETTATGVSQIFELVTQLGTTAGAAALVWWLLVKRLPEDEKRNREERAALELANRQERQANQASYTEDLAAARAENREDRERWAEKLTQAHHDCEDKMETVRTMAEDRFAAIQEETTSRIEKALENLHAPREG